MNKEYNEMKKIVLFSAIALLAANTANAQETYENAKLANQDLNGTARYVGMGGAMDALGADLSTISSNPAGIGIFRHSTVNASFGFVSQQDGKSFGAFVFPFNIHCVIVRCKHSAHSVSLDRCVKHVVLT